VSAGRELARIRAIVWKDLTAERRTKANFNAVVFGSQFVAVGNGGAIYVSADGVTWQAAKSGTTNDLYALVYSASVAANTLAVGYTAVGAAGVNLTSY